MSTLSVEPTEWHCLLKLLGHAVCWRSETCTSYSCCCQDIAADVCREHLIEAHSASVVLRKALHTFCVCRRLSLSFVRHQMLWAYFRHRTCSCWQWICSCSRNNIIRLCSCFTASQAVGVPAWHSICWSLQARMEQQQQRQQE
jgi:hypothetical protein